MYKKIFFSLLFLSFSIYSMEYAFSSSSSSSPSTVSADPEALTFEQMEKEREERELNSSTRNSELKEDKDTDGEWYCERRLAKTNGELEIFNKLDSMGKKVTDYDNICLCSLDNGKFGALYSFTSFAMNFYRIKIFDANSGKCLNVIDPLENEIAVTPLRLCKLSENRIACVVEYYTNCDQKIKIYDVQSGKFLKEIIIQDKDIKVDGLGGVKIKNEVYLPNNKMALFISNGFDYCKFILILDLETNKILRRIDLIQDITKKGGEPFLEFEDIFKRKNWHGIKIRNLCVLSDQSLLLSCDENIAIISYETSEIKLLKEYKKIRDLMVLPNNEWLSLDEYNALKIWKNEKFKFDTIHQILNENNKVPISGLQNIVFEYLSKDWCGQLLEKVGSDYPNSSIINKNNILFFTDDWVMQVFNVKTSKFQNLKINRGKAHFGSSEIKKSISFLDNGKRIVFCYLDGSIEIWTNQPRTNKENVLEACIIC